MSPNRLGETGVSSCLWSVALLLLAIDGGREDLAPHSRIHDLRYQPTRCCRCPWRQMERSLSLDRSWPGYGERRKIWSLPSTRKKLLEELSDKGYTEPQREDLRKLVHGGKRSLRRAQLRGLPKRHGATPRPCRASHDPNQGLRSQATSIPQLRADAVCQRGSVRAR